MSEIVRSHPATNWKRRSAAPAVLLVLVILFCARFLFGDDALLLPDLFSLETPGYILYRDSLLGGSLPLWTPYSGCGEPYLAGSDIGVFYPPNLIFLFVPLRTAIAVFATFHIFFSGIATYALSRFWKVSRLGSLLAATSFALGSWSITRVEFLPTLASVPWFPVCLAVFTYWLYRPRLRVVLLLAICLAMGLLAGWPEGSYFTGCSLVLYGLVAGVQQFRISRRWFDALRPLCVVFFAGFLAILLSAVQILPTWEAVELSQRSEAIDPGLDSASVDPFMLVSLVIPSIYGLPAARYTGNYWAPSCVEYYHGTFYIGVLPVIILLMAMAAFVDSRTKLGPKRLRPAGRVAIRTPFLLSLTIVSLLYAMGKYTPVFPFLWEHVSLIQKFHGPSKSMICFVLATSCLSGVGLDYLGRTGRRTDTSKSPMQGYAVRSLPILITLLAVSLAGLCLFRSGEAARDLYFRLSSVDRQPNDAIPWQVLGFDTVKFSILAVVSAFLLARFASGPLNRSKMGWCRVGVLFLDLFTANSPLVVTGESRLVEFERPSSLLAELRPEGRPVRFHRPIRGHELYGERDGRLYRRARDTLRGWWSTVDRAYNLNQSGVFRPRSVTRVLDLLNDPDVSDDHRQRLLAMLNCERIVPTHVEPLYVTGRVDYLIITPLKPSLPRAYVVGGVRILRDGDAVIDELAYGEFDPLAVALVDRRTALESDVGSLRPDRIRHEIRSIQYGQNRLDITADSQRKGLLVVSDTYYPGWVAEVNGRKSRLLRVNGGFRGVRIPAGESRISMTYRPASLRVGALVSLASLVVVLVFGIWRGRKQNTPGNSSAGMVRPASD